MITIVDELVERHRILQVLVEKTTEDDAVSQVKEFLIQLAETGTQVSDTRLRSRLWDLINYWSDFVYDHTREFPDVVLKGAVLTSLPTIKPPPFDWLEFAQLPVLSKPVPAGELRNFVRQSRVYATATRFIIQDKMYEIVSLDREPRVLLKPGHSYIVLRVSGDSMVDADIAEGDFVVLRWLKEGEKISARVCVVAAEVAGEREVTLKEYVDTGRKQYLQARNSSPGSEWKDYRIEIDRNVRIHGIVIAVLKPVRE